jgi:glutamate formiminotransferase/glutamate formiminotransferase/formiminotetrahydrofolate cyclodeaminase
VADDLLLAVPNVSEGRDEGVLGAIARAYEDAGARLLDRHSDPDHNRTVFTLAAPPRTLGRALLEGARAAVDRIDLRSYAGIHPHVGAVDVVPVVFRADEQRGAACAEALVAADRIGSELGIPVLLYGLLADGRTRAELRRGGPTQLARRLEAQELEPDFGPPRPHATAGATLVAARAPLLAFNVELAPPATEEDAKRIAAAIRDGGEEGLASVRAIGRALPSRGDVAQVSINVDDHRRTNLAQVVGAIARHARIGETELIGLAPREAFDGFPQDVPVRNRATIEERLHS